MSVKELDTRRLEKDIRALIRDLDEEEFVILKNQNVTLWIQALGEKYNYLANNVPNLFELVLQTGRDFDFSMMKQFFETYDNVRRGKVTKETADLKIEEIGRKRWIDPILESEDFKQYKKVTTTITPRGKPFDFPAFAVDSLPWLVHSIKISLLNNLCHDILPVLFSKFDIRMTDTLGVVPAKIDYGPGIDNRFKTSPSALAFSYFSFSFFS